jgi:drug/metabolite transporter (DMT)-like permease
VLPAILTVICWSFSGVTGSKAARLLGSIPASFWRLVVGLLLLGAYAHTFGQGVSGPGFKWFFISGLVGFGLGDTALYLAYPRIGSRLSMMLVHCLATPFAATIEWIWLGVSLTPAQLLAGAIILCGVAIGIAPSGPKREPHPHLVTGTILGVIAACGQATGAVLSRKAFALTPPGSAQIDGLTSAYQRLMGGLVVAIVVYTLFKLTSGFGDKTAARSHGEVNAGRRWLLWNALTGPGLGAACYQWALATTPSGIVLPIVSLTPLAMIPLAERMEGDRATRRSIIGGVIAVAGVIALHLSRR